MFSEQYPKLRKIFFEAAEGYVVVGYYQKTTQQIEEAVTAMKSIRKRIDDACIKSD